MVIKLLTHIISMCQGIADVWVHVVMVKCHEKCVEPNTQHDEKVDEGIENEQRQELKHPIQNVHHLIYQNMYFK